MFAEVKGMLPVSGDGYDAEIITQIKACVRDLTATAEIVLPGTVSIKRTLEAATTSEPEHYVITDTSSLKDDYVITVIAIWCNMHIGNPPNYDNLQQSYRDMKGSMRLSRQYTRYGGGADECGC